MKLIECDRCGLEAKVSDDVVSILCHYCVNETTQPPTSKTKKKTGYPKGWKFMTEFVHTDGSVYHKGILQPHLKGTITATPLVEKPKVSKKQRAEQKQSLMEEIADLKKKLKTETRKTIRKKIEIKLNKISKLI